MLTSEPDGSGGPSRREAPKHRPAQHPDFALSAIETINWYFKIQIQVVLHKVKDKQQRQAKGSLSNVLSTAELER